MVDVAELTYMTMSGFRCSVSGRLTWKDSLVPVVAALLSIRILQGRATNIYLGQY